MRAINIHNVNKIIGESFLLHLGVIKVKHGIVDLLCIAYTGDERNKLFAECLEELITFLQNI